MQKGVILYYIVGPVHVHNLVLIEDQMPGWEFRGAYEADVSWFTSEQMETLHFEAIPLRDDHLPESLWHGDVRAIIFSTAQLRKTPVNLLQQAMQRNIPAIAIEESIQIALNGGRINNYLLPVDHLLVASEIEREGMITAGVPKQRLTVTGWPFYTGQVGGNTPTNLHKSKARLGLDADRPVAALTLTALGDAGESPKARSRQLSLAASGLPGDFQLVVKPHPIEPLESLEPFIRALAPQAYVLPGKLPISDLLEATDVLLNRGASQVCFEALLREIPVIILDTGIRTPFHGLVPEALIVGDASELPRALESIASEGDRVGAYKSFLAAHMPYTPEKAREMTCKRIAEIASHCGEVTATERRWFDLALCQAWVGNAVEALSILERCRGNEMHVAVQALRKLVDHQASPEDLKKLRESVGLGFPQMVLQSLWVRQLAARGGKPTADELEWMQDFPPTTNTSWFISPAWQWSAILIRSKEKEALRSFIERLEREFKHEPGINALMRYLQEYQDSLLGRIKYRMYWFSHRVREMSRPARRTLMKLILRREN